MIRLIDGNNVLRRSLDTDITGLVPRNIFTKASPNDIWVWDAPDGNARRRKIYPEYKMKRTKTPEDIRATISFVKELLVHTSAMQITVPTFEADDVIASFAKGVEECHIVSNDSDYLQLGVPCDAKPIPGVEAKYVRLYKTLCGDSADNIPGLKGFGPKSFEKINKEFWNAWFSIDHQFVNLEAACDPLDNKIVGSLDLMRKFYEITGFFDVPLPLIQQHLSVGVPSFEKGDAMLKEFLN